MTTRNTVLFDCSETAQDAMRPMVLALGKSFEALGWKFGTYSFTSWDAVAPLTEAINTGTLGLVVSIGGDSSGSYAQFGPFLTRDRVPFFLFGFDHPAYAYGEMQEMLDTLDPLHISFTVPDFAWAADTLWPGKGHYTILAQAASEAPMIDLAERTGPGLMAGNRPSYGPLQPIYPEDMPEMAEQYRPHRDRLRALYHTDPALPLFQTIWATFPELSEVDKRRLAILFDLGQRIRIRTEAIEALLDHDVDIYGQGWDHLARPGMRLSMLGSIHNDQVQDKIKMAKYLVNAVPEYYACSERILEAAMCGCPVVTTWTRYLEQEFGDSLWFYRTPDELKAAIAEIVAGRGVREKIERARAVVMARHLWKHRAQAILDAVGLSKAG